MLAVHEIYLSLQGESSFAGLPCIFVRLTACNLRCSYCDTAYAFSGGERMSVEDVLGKVRNLAGANDTRAGEHRLPLVELTGGEPLLQPDVLPLMNALCQEGHTVLLETSGARDISVVPAAVRRIMDLKCPSSGEVQANLWSNLDHLKSTDEIKFVVATVQDYEWMVEQIQSRGLSSLCPLLVSWVHPLAPGQQDKSLKSVPERHQPLSRRALVERIIADRLPVRFQAQLHKIIWPPDERGV